jgi:hypothetical protein
MGPEVNAMRFVIVGFVTAPIVVRGVRNDTTEDPRQWAAFGFVMSVVAAALGGRFASDLLIVAGSIPTDPGNDTIVHVTAFAAMVATTAARTAAPRYIGIGETAAPLAPIPASAPRTRSMEPRTITGA